MNAAQIARAAAQLAASRELLAEQAEADAARDKLQAQVEVTFDLAAAKLKQAKWFPSVTWVVYDSKSTLYGASGFGDGTCIVLADASDPSGPVKLMVTRVVGFGDILPRLDIRFARREYSEGYYYYTSNPVHSAADVGKLLK